MDKTETQHLLNNLVRGWTIEQCDNSAQQIYQAFLQQCERPMLQAIMAETCGNQSEAAQRLGINRATLRAKLKRYDLMSMSTSPGHVKKQAA